MNDVQRDKNKPGLRIIANRGVSSLAPENTIAAFSKCLDFGIEWFKFDVEMLLDSSLVVVHDDTADRTTSGEGAFRKKTFAEVRRLDAGLWFGEAFRFERIPELATVVELLNSTVLSAYLEIRPTVHSQDSQEALIEVLVRSLGQLKNPQKMVVSSYSADYLALFRRLQIEQSVSEIALAYLVDAARIRVDMSGAIRQAQELGCLAIHPANEGLSEEQVRAMKSANLQVNVWTVNDAVRAQELQSWGVDGVFSDFPQDLLAPKKTSG